MNTHSELTLSGVLKISAPAANHLPLTEGLQLSLQVVRLVAAAHDKGQVVGVLDAAHLVCSNSGKLALGGKGGNPIAPELKRGEMPDRLTDVYALGALMYRLLTGRRVDPSRVIEPPSHFNPAVDSSLDELVLSALDEDPSERPYSARDLEQRLLGVYEELGLEDTSTAAHRLIASIPKPKPVAVARPEETIDYDGEDEDDDLEPVLDRNPLEKKWLIGGIGALALFLIVFIAWPSSSPKKKEVVEADDAPAQVAKAPTPTISPVQAKLVAPEKPAKVAVAKKSNRRARR